jgi:parallel beta-helix repeat protein
MEVPVSPNASNLPAKIKGAAIAAFLLVLLLAVLPFFFSGFASAPNSNQVLTATPKEKIGLNADNSGKYSEGTTAPIQNFSVGANSESYAPASPTNQTTTLQTHVEINLQPNPVAVLELVSIRIIVSPAPPTLNDRFSNLTLFVLRPDGTAEILGPFQSDSNGSLSLNYTPEMIGTYSVQASYGGQFFARSGTTYLTAESSMITLSVATDLTPSTPRIWVVDDDGPADFHTIREAIDAASPGDIICVRNGHYYEHLVIDKSLQLLGQNAGETVIDGKLAGHVVLLVASNISITGFTIARCGTYCSGILINGTCPTYSRYNNIEDNNFVSNYECIRLVQSSNNVIQRNNMEDSQQGIILSHSLNNILCDNSIVSCNAGITLDLGSSNNVLQNNHIANTHYGFGTGNNWGLSDYINDVDSSNTIDGKPIYYIIDKSNVTVPSDAGCVVLVHCTHVIVQNLCLTRDISGVLLAYSDNSTVTNNNLTNNAEGIELQHSINNFLSRNSISSNVNGIVIGQACHNNIITENNLTKNLQSQINIGGSASNNYIYHNNFFYVLQYCMNASRLVPSQQVIQYSSNVWDNGYPSGGNFWSNYGGTDGNSDGFGDTSFVIEVNTLYGVEVNEDHYPLMVPFL